ncbi:MAG: pyruvate formate lyase family protein [Bacillota bacterium]
MIDNALNKEMDALNYGKHQEVRNILSVEREIRFTEVYRAHEKDHPHKREIACLKKQAEETLMPIREEDWFAGRIDRMLVGIDPERGSLTEAAYFCRFEVLKEYLANPNADEELRGKASRLLDYWRGRTTYEKCRKAFPEYVKQGLPSDDYYAGFKPSYPMYGLGGPCLDWEKLTRLGVCGLKAEVGKRAERAEEEGGDFMFFWCLEAALDVFSRSALNYMDQARRLAETATGDARKRLLLIAESLTWIAEFPPQTYHQAIQLVWLYSLVALPRNYGRMDVYLGGFLARDLDNGVLTQEEAKEMTIGLWRLIVARGDNFNNRIIIGGKGRPNERNADCFAMLALEVQEAVRESIPQLSLRVYDGMNPALLDKALRVIEGGSTFPIIYNDDVNVPASKENFNVGEREAEQYLMYGCGEFLLEHRSVGSPDAVVNILKVLDITLHNGRDTFTGEIQGLALGGLQDFASFEDLQETFTRQLGYQIELLAAAQATIYFITGHEAAFPLLSLLYDDCITRGKPLLAGGVRYLGGTMECFGNNSAADSLLAIKKAVYEQKLLAPGELLACLECNYEGREKERRILLSMPKFGNDDPEADAMSLWVNRIVYEAAQNQAARVGLASFLPVLINNGDSILFGKTTAASADGRKSGEPLSNGNQPSAGFDRSGITALLNSMAKLGAKMHAGATHNLKISRGVFKSRPQEIGALLKGYFARGGTQIMVTVTDRGELEKALKEPERYGNLIVRVGGYSERFINLPREIQQEVLRRTLY